MDEAVLVIDKVAGPSSFDVVRSVRNYVRIKKVGHAGTLDPFATGVLVLLTGKATKLSNALLNADKKYQAVITLGQATDSMDCTGNVVETQPVPHLTSEEAAKVLKSFEGAWDQIPPMYSAKKVQGVRLYELARKNISIKRDPIRVELFSLELLSLCDGKLKFEVHCSKGTYVRSLADEIARKLGTVGFLSELRRISCGGFSLKESLTVAQLTGGEVDWKTQGYRNYVKLLSAEGVVRGRQWVQPAQSSVRDFSSPWLESKDRQVFPGAQSSHLPTEANSGMSFHN
jgi:tRNA pseudouridine55 synthase